MTVCLSGDGGCCLPPEMQPETPTPVHSIKHSQTYGMGWLLCRGSSWGRALTTQFRSVLSGGLASVQEHGRSRDYHQPLLSTQDQPETHRCLQGKDNQNMWEAGPRPQQLYSSRGAQLALVSLTNWMGTCISTKICILSGDFQ